jgi:uncharacterized protein YrrD
MEKVMLFQKGADVIDVKGQSIGSLERVVLNPDSKLVTDIVIRMGPLFSKQDKVVSIVYIAETTENQIVLTREAEELDSFPPFEERHLVVSEEEPRQNPTDVPPVVYGSPGFGPMIVEAPGEKIVTKIEQNIPEETVAVKEGAKVITADGKYIGNVERVLSDTSVNQATNLEISKGLLVKERRLIPMKWVMSIGEDEIRLRVNEALIDTE